MTAFEKEGSHPTHKIKRKFGVKMPMRDGVKLSVDIWIPAEPWNYPAILIRTPYLKTMALFRFPEFGEYFASRGYAFLVQDVRGRGDSEGKFNFFLQEADDGYDSVEWIACQQWSNGKVGMMGVSYLGRVQLEAARRKPPHFVCMVPTASTERWFELHYQGGAFMAWGRLRWLYHVSDRIYQSNLPDREFNKIKERRPIHRPLLTLDEAVVRRLEVWREKLNHPTLDDFWKKFYFNETDYRNMDFPALHVTGWFDTDQPGALANWDGMQAYSPAKDKQYLLIGPWNHMQTFLGGSLAVGEMEFSGDSVIDIKALHLAFFNHFLKGSMSDFDFPRVRIYVTGLNKWLDVNEYPPSRIKYHCLYLHSKGKANTSEGDGHLSWTAPEDELTDCYTYNPEDPVPSHIGGEYSGIDQRVVERRDDILVYTSEVLKERLTIIGRVYVNLYAASDTKDTDFTSKIMDVYPDGRVVKLGPVSVGVLRARYRKSLEHTELLTPSKTELFKIELFDIGHAFMPEHRIRIEISSSAYPFIYPNTNTGNNAAKDIECIIAHQTIYHDEHNPSHVYLPVMMNHSNFSKL